MTTWLSRTGRAVAYAIAVFVVLAVVTRVMVFVWAAYALAAGLSYAYLAASERGRAVEDGRVDVLLEPTASSKVEVAQGSRVAFQLRVRNRGGVVMPRVSLRLPECSGLQWEQASLTVGAVGPGSESRLVIHARALRSGRWTLHGIELATEDWLAWSRVSRWMPQRARVTIVPRPVVDRSRVVAERVEARGALPAGLHRARRAGDGYDIRQLREFGAGDDLRRIAWAASARRGKLLLRQNEDEVTTSHIVALDLASSLRAGPADAIFEATLAIAAAGIAEAERRRDRIGIMSFAEEPLGALPCRDGSVHYRNLTEHLLTLATSTDAAITEAGRAEVVERLVDHLLLHDRVQFRIPNAEALAPLDERIRLDALRHWLRTTHATELETALRRRESAGFSADVDIERVAAHALGIEFAPRSASWTPHRLRGFRASLERVPELTRQRATVVMLTDLSGTTEWAGLKDTVRALQARGHRLSLLVPDVPSFVPSATSDVADEVRRLFAVAETAVRGQVAAQWRSMGVPVRFFGPDDAPQAIWEAACLSAAGARSERISLAAEGAT